VEWIGPVKDFWWLFGVLLAILAALWRLAIQTNKSKERLEQVSTNKEAIQALQADMVGMKDDLSDIKEGVEQQRQDTAAIFQVLQAMLSALDSNDCNIGSAREKFNSHLANR
jgi:predicted phage tail protein